MTKEQGKIIVPADKLAKAVEKHLLPGLLRSLRERNVHASSTEPNHTRTKKGRN